MVVRLQIRHDISANWKKYNPVLAIGEMGIETDNANEGNRIKIGDGNRKWLELPFMDEKSVHKFADEIIYGKKSFEDTLNLNQGCVIPDPYTMDGLATRAVADEDGNNFNDYYQKTLKNATSIDNTTDWNTLTDVGYYKVDLASWGNATVKHSPNDYSDDVNKQGILSVIGNDTYMFQKYTPLSNDTTLCRYCDNGSWSVWAPLNAGDSTLVHTSGDETIGGVKTFSNNVNVSAGNINFNKGGDASILKEGTAFITNTSGGSTIISSDSNGTISLRPNGPNNTDGEIIIGNDGTIQGKITSDSAGNSIIDNYVQKNQMESFVFQEGLSAILMGRNFVNNTLVYAELLEMKNNGIGTFTDIIKDGAEALEIPYTLTRGGIKIVDIAYADRVESCYEEFNTGNYFIIDEVNKLYQTPYDTVDGHCVKIGFGRTGSVSYEFDTNLECTQTGTCVADTPFTFAKEFANTDYNLSCPYSAKTTTGFTPTQSGDFIAKGVITLNKVMPSLNP